MGRGALVTPALILVAVLAVAMLCGASASSLAADNPDTTGWKDLFAADLSNAIGKEHWSMENGVLVAKDHETPSRAGAGCQESPL